jgi:dTDP-4-amino-4,6-dideoxygalactose transaminase
MQAACALAQLEKAPAFIQARKDNFKFLKERLMDTSDAYSTYVCDICGLFAQRVIKKENKTSYS